MQVRTWLIYPLPFGEVKEGLQLLKENRRRGNGTLLEPIVFKDFYKNGKRYFLIRLKKISIIRFLGEKPVCIFIKCMYRLGFVLDFLNEMLLNYM